MTFRQAIIARAAATIAFNEAWLVIGGLFVFALVLVPFLRRPHPGSRTNRNPFLKGSLTMFRLPFRKLAFVLAVALAYAGAAPASAAGLPRLEADALGGNHVVLPTDAAGKPLVLLLAFTPESKPN